MAIDYREEWEKFRVYYGRRRVETKDGTVALGKLMSDWIDDVIESRERLMEQYAKTLFSTEIVKSKENGHLVEVRFRGGPAYGKLFVTKEEFNTWLKKRKEVK